MSPRKPLRTDPAALYRKAGGDTAEYLRLMREHGHLIPEAAHAPIPPAEDASPSSPPVGDTEGRHV